MDLTEPSVQAALAGLFRAVAGHAGAGGTVCRAAAPPGFDRSYFRAQYDGMGYNPILRLAYLRKSHIDPVDAGEYQFRGFVARADASLPNFPDRDYQMQAKWSMFRAEALQTAWKALFDSVTNGAGEPSPGLLIGREYAALYMNWYDDWSSPKTPMPSASLYFSPPQPDAKTGIIPKPTDSILFLSKQPPYTLPKPQAEHNWLDVQMKNIETYKRYRN